MMLLKSYGPAGDSFNNTSRSNCTYVWYTTLPLVSYHT